MSVQILKPIYKTLNHFISLYCLALPHLQNLINQTHQLDTSAKKILNNSAVFFLVEVGGVNYTISSSKLIYNPVVKCPQGSVRLDIFCGKCFVVYQFIYFTNVVRTVHDLSALI